MHEATGAEKEGEQHRSFDIVPHAPRPREIRHGFFPVENGNEATTAFPKKNGKIEARAFRGSGWTVMRDIRGDLEERAFLIEAQIVAAGADFDDAVEQLKNKLRADIASLGVALLAEQYRNYLADMLPGEGRQ